MRTILVFGGKGGSGKTTVSRELAVAGTMEGRRVAIADLDPQRGLTGWYGRRQAETPAMVALPEPYDVSGVAKAGFDELVIDMPPGVPAFLRRLVPQADLVLMPCRPSPDDLSAAAAASGELDAAKSWAFVLTQTLPRSRLTEGALRQLAALGRVAPVTLGLRQDFPVAAIEGKAAVEFSGSKSAEETKELRSYVDTLARRKDGKEARR